MRFTNKHSLPQSVFEAITKDNYTGKKNDLSVISATTLIQPPKIRLLTMRHADEIEEDAVDNVWRLLGSAVHSVLQNVTDEDKFLEERINVEFCGKTISMQIDVMNHKEHSIDDYKITSAWSLTYEPQGKKEWVDQLNIYSWGLRKSGLDFKIDKLRVIVILRDWSEKNVGSGDYPNSPIKVIELPLWSFEKQEQYVEERVRLHTSFESATDDQIIYCSAEERWAKPSEWAVYNGENKKAERGGLHSSESSAQLHANTMIELGKKPRIEYRPGEDVRCDRYCAVNKFCNYYKQKQSI